MGRQPGAGRPTRDKAILIAQRREKALQLRIQGLSFDQIAARLNSSHAVVYNDVQIMLDRLDKATLETAEKLRQIELRRLEIATAAIMPAVVNGDLQAIDRLVRISERRSRLMGLDRQVEAVAAEVRVIVERRDEGGDAIETEARVVGDGENNAPETAQGSEEDSGPT